MDNFLNRDEKQTWGFCRKDPHTQPCPDQQAIIGHASQRKQGLQKVKASKASALSARRQLIPPEVFEQLDRLLEQATQSMMDGEETPILSPSMWDAILILRNTDIRLSEL